MGESTIELHAIWRGAARVQNIASHFTIPSSWEGNLNIIQVFPAFAGRQARQSP